LYCFKDLNAWSELNSLGDRSNLIGRTADAALDRRHLWNSCLVWPEAYTFQRVWDTGVVIESRLDGCLLPLESLQLTAINTRVIEKMDSGYSPGFTEVSLKSCCSHGFRRLLNFTANFFLSSSERSKT